MALTTNPVQLTPTEQAQNELQDLFRLIQEQQRLLIEEQGFQEVQQTLPFEEAFEQATAEQRRTRQIEAKRRQLLERQLQQFQEQGIDPTSPEAQETQINLVTPEEQALGIIPPTGQTATLAELPQILDQTVNRLQTIENQIRQVTRLEKTPERLAQEERLKEFRERQERLLTLQAERQEKALKGELPISEATQQAKQQQFEQFKESQARLGNIIIGDTPETAAAKGTGAQKALENFRTRFGLVEQAERRGEIQAGGALFQSALGQVPTLGPGFAGTVPQVASPFGLQSINLASQPFFQQQQLDLQRAALEAQRAAQRGSSRSALLGAGIGALGSIAGGFLAGPFGSLGGQQVTNPLIQSIGGGRTTNLGITSPFFLP